MSWTLRKMVLTGMFAVLAWIIQLAVAATFVMTFGPAMGGPVMFFLAPLVFVLFRRIIAEKGALLLLGLIASLLFLPIPALGPPGFLPKIVILLGICIPIELVLLVLKKRAFLGATLGGIAGGVVGFVLILIFFKIFKIPGGEKALSLALPFAILAMVEGGVGGFIGEKLYRKIEKRPFVQRLQRG